MAKKPEKYLERVKCEAVKQRIKVIRPWRHFPIGKLFTMSITQSNSPQEENETKINLPSVGK